MTESKHIQELNRKIKHLKKTGTGGSDFRLLIRLTVLVAYYQKQPIERIAGCLNISVNSVKRWIKRYKSKGIDFVRDEDRSGCPSGLSIEQQEHLKNKMQESNQRVWVARHVVVLIQTLFGVLYSVAYLPQLLKKLGLSFHKAVTTLIKRDSEKRRVWIQETLPEIYRQKIEAEAGVFFTKMKWVSRPKAPWLIRGAFEGNRQRSLTTDGMVG